MSQPDAPALTGTGGFGARLLALREAAGLTQEELAERAGLTSYAVSALERGRRQRPYPHTVRSLADALGLSEDDRAGLLAAVPRRGAVTTPAPAVPTPAVPVASPPPVAPAPAPSATAAPLLGRDEERAALRELLLEQDRRLVTVTGTGGVGKTRLARTVATDVGGSFPDGVTVVSLAPLNDPGSVLPAIARALGCPVVDETDAARLLVEQLRPLRSLLVVDNLEHLLGAAGHLADLVADCPHLAVLVTSRAPLRVRGEVEFPLQPLTVPTASSDVADVQGCAAVQVFVDRARSVSPSFDLTDDNVAAVAALCRRLAGIPLALELAAARVRFLTPQALLARLDDAMARAGGPDLPARQRTMRATFDWSYDLLAEAEQRLLRLLSVFASGCPLEAIEDISDRLGHPEPVLPLLEVLVEHSLVVASNDEEGRPRFGLLEPVAQYARMREDADDWRRLRDAHAASYLEYAEQAAEHVLDRDQITWLDRSERVDADLVAAMSWAVSSGDGETAGRLAWALWMYWRLRSRAVLGLRLTEEALRLDMSPPVRALATNAAASMAYALGDLQVAADHWRETERLARLAELPSQVAAGLAGPGLVALSQGDPETAERQFLLALPHTRGTDAFGDWLASMLQVWLGTAHRIRGDLEAAAAAMQLGLQGARASGDRLTACVALLGLGQVVRADGDHARARTHLLEGLRLSSENRDLAYVATFLQELSGVMSASGEHHRAAVLQGASETVGELTGTTESRYRRLDEGQRARSAALTREALGEDAYDDTVDAGRSLTPAEAVAYALADEGSGSSMA